ncbi:MAG: hypothetical protein LKF99_04830 [Bifidobacterium sp.]|nr:hypothetical protein [Bifidobacterium sp.]
MSADWKVDENVESDEAAAASWGERRLRVEAGTKLGGVVGVSAPSGSWPILVPHLQRTNRLYFYSAFEGLPRPRLTSAQERHIRSR